jgi:hypothetical protein
MIIQKLTPVVTSTLIAACLLSGCAHTDQTEQGKPMPTAISMPAPASDSGNIYARGMSAILSHLGPELSYDQAMGLSGVAFILQVDTSGPYLPGKELDCAWWPNDDWGFELGLPVLTKAAGWEISKLSADMDAYKANPETEFRRVFPSAIEKSLRAGKPVLSYGFVCIDTDQQQRPLLGYGTKGHSTRYGQSKTRIQRYPWHLYVIGNKVSADSPTDVDLASLRHIIALFNEQAQGPNAPKTRFSGKQAWAEWLRLLRAGSACDNNMLIHLRYNRRSAVAYLREMAKRHTGVTATHLSSAADLYQSIVDEVMKEGLPYNRVKSGEDEKTVRSECTAMIERVSKLEAQAIAELKAAAESIAGTP